MKKIDEEVHIYALIVAEIKVLDKQTDPETL